MSDLQIIKNRIRELRENLHTVLNEEENVSSSRVLEISKELDKTLNEYYKLISREKKE